MENQFFSDLSKLEGNPFTPAAGADHPYLSSSFREALASLYYGLENGSRILLLSADPGLGKTTLLRHLERRLLRRGRTLFVTSNPDDASNDGKASEVLRKLLCEIGGERPNGDLEAMGIKIDGIIPTLVGTENPFILLLDYDETGPALEIIYHLANLQSLQRGLLRIVIAGPTGVAEELLRSKFAENIRHVPLAPLTTPEVESYIEYRLRLGGWKGGPLFTAKAYAAIAERSSAKPSAINEICFNLLQRLSEPGTSHFPAAGHNGEATLDESYINVVLTGRKSASGALSDNEAAKAARPVSSLNRRTATLACVIVIVVIAIAGLWYRIAIKQHSAKDVTTQIISLFAAALHNALFHDAPATELSNPPQAINASGVPGTAIIASPKTGAGSGPAHDVGTANLPHVASEVVSDGSSPAPGKATTSKAVALGPANGMPIVPSTSPAITAPKNAEVYSTEPVAKKDLNVSSAPVTRTASSSPMSKSSLIAAKTTAPSTVVAPGRLVTAGKDTAPASPSTAEMADYEIRRGDSYMTMGDYDKAVVSFSIAIAFAPNNKEAQEKIRRARSAKATEENVLQ